MAYTTINKYTAHFDTKTWSGNNTDPTTISGLNFQPDMIWGKARSGSYGTQDHCINDAVRGANKIIRVNQTTAQETDTDNIKSFTSDGWTMGNDGKINQASTEYVGWSWKANGAGSSNTDGNNITSTVSANTTSGFSVVKYSGTGSASDTIGHGLGVKPACVIMRPLSYAGAWWIAHKDLTTDNLLEFNSNAQAAYSSFGGGGLRYSTFTTSVIGGGNGSSNSELWNKSGEDYIAYCFAEKTGFSKCNKYIGNGSTDGTFVYTGFKPSFILFKLSSATADWQIFDNKREGYNNVNDALFPNLNSAEGSSARIQLLSNGFKLIDNNNWGWNKSGETYVYMAIGQSLVGSNNIPCTAR